MAVVWDRSYLESLFDNKIPETQEVEYKVKPPIKDDPKDVQLHKRYLKQREEFLKDVSGMANAGGGIIIFGVSDDGKVIPLTEVSGETYDQLTMRLGQWINLGIEPRPHGIVFEKIAFDGGYVLLLSIPNTMAGPFWGKVPGEQGAADTGRRIFKIRRGTSVIDMSYHEVREAFDRNSNALVQARNWVRDRVKDYHLSRDLATPFLHIIPLAGYQRVVDPLTIKDMRANEAILHALFDEGDFNGRHNFDGFRLSSDEHYEARFVQIFRNGALEISDKVWYVNEDYPDRGTSKFIVDESLLTNFICRSLDSGLEYCRQNGPHSSAMVCFSIVQSDRVNYIQGHHPKATDRFMMEVPPFIVESGPSIEEIDRVAKGMLDMIAQGYGFAQCIQFRHGIWTGRRTDS